MKYFPFLIGFLVLFGCCYGQKSIHPKVKEVVKPLRAELLPATTPYVHASTILETSSGKLLVGWFGGVKEGSDDDKIYLTHYQKEFRTWSAPQVVAASEEIGETLPCWNPVLFQMQSGMIILFYKIGKEPSLWNGYIKRSFDDGITWSKPEPLPKGILGPTKNKPIYHHGNLICGSSIENKEGRTVWIDYSRDEGYTWERIGPLAPTDQKTIQPSLFVNPDDTLSLFCRSCGGWIYTSRTSDQEGLKWTNMTTTCLPSNDSGIDGITLEKGNLFLLAFNDIILHINSRNWLRLAFSKDQGKNWKKGATIEWSIDPFDEFSYPAVIQTRDGLIHITYTWKKKHIKHVILDMKEAKK